jgi:hypothetical protein
MPRRTLIPSLLAGMLVPTAALAGNVTFAVKPAAAKVGDQVKISFAVSAPTDVEVAVLNADGKVVRSLAAGVLGGPNPPPAPLKPGLAQELIWDGKGDWGLPVGNGPFKVRVRAGMGVNFGRTVGDSAYNFHGMYARGLAVDPERGDLYCLVKPQRSNRIVCLRVYDRTGKYLREIMPYPATVDARSREVFGSVSAPNMESPAPRNYLSTWPVFYPFDPGNDVGPTHITLLLNPAEKGAVVLLDDWFGSLWRIRSSDGGAGEPFKEALWPPEVKLLGSGANASTTGAYTPDGKTLYVTGYSGFAPKGSKLHATWPEGRIYRRRIGSDQTEVFADVALPPDAPVAVPGSSGSSAQNLHGLAVDSRGNVFVCDAAGAKVRIFSPAGKEIGAIETPPKPYLVALNEKEGALYVLTRRLTRPYMYPDALVKILGWTPGRVDGGQAATKVAATLSFPKSPPADPFMAVDLTGDRPQIWLSGASRTESLLRIADRGDDLVVLEDLADRGRTASGFAVRIDVDPEADLVYVNNGCGQIRRYDGITGAYAGKTGRDGAPEPISGSEFCVRRDGMVYVSGDDNLGGGFSGPFSRLHRDLTPAPLPDGRKQFVDRYGKWGGGYFGNGGSCVTPDGRLYFNALYYWRANAIFEVTPDGRPGRCPRLGDLPAGAFSQQYTKVGFTGAYIGWLTDQSGGVEVDQQGHVYAGIRVLPRDYVLPGDFAMTRGYSQMTGSVIKFDLAGGGMQLDAPAGTKYTVPISAPSVLAVPEKFAPGLPMGPGQRLKQTYIEGGIRAYPGLAVFSGFERGEGHCACQTPRFEVDDFGRLYIPNALACSVQVVDNEGNEILRFGGYGNFDACSAPVRAPQTPDGATTNTPTIPLGYPCAAKASFKHIYVADSANRRVVRVDPTWTVEDTCEPK